MLSKVNELGLQGQTEEAKPGQRAAAPHRLKAEDCPEDCQAREQQLPLRLRIVLCVWHTCVSLRQQTEGFSFPGVEW